MERGKIKKKLKYSGFIEIRPSKDIYFNSRNLVDVTFKQLSEGDIVEFMSGQGQQGPEAYQVKLIKKIVKPRFLNPYNFVRFLPEGTADNEKKRLLGRCQPPAHDKFTDISGKIKCTMLTETRLFVAGKQEKDSNPLEFFKAGDQPIIPASSLRGMIRSLYETITNSCYEAFEYDEKPGSSDRLEFRYSRDPGLIPARVISLDEKGGELEVLDCRTNKMPKDLDKLDDTLVLRTALLKAYSPKVKPDDSECCTNLLPDFAHDGLRVAALVYKKLKPHYYRGNPNFQYLVVHSFVPATEEKEIHETDDTYKVFGYLKITGPNIENKHDERLFFRWDDKNQKTDPIPRQKISLESIEEYNRYLKKYRERHKERLEDLDKQQWAINANNIPHLSNFLKDDDDKEKKVRELKENDLVYFLYDKKAKRIRLFPVCMPRSAYLNPREKLLPKHLHACEEYDALCPACRLFGWVAPQKKKAGEQENKINAYAGRVRFSNGNISQSANWIIKDETNPLVLSILGSPKPTTTPFYLLTEKGEAKYDVWNPDERKPQKIDYDTEGAQLRGRKFYRHHGYKLFSKIFPNGEHEWEQAGRMPSKHNVTLKEVLDRNSTITFSIDFENLNPVELGALLWTLRLEEGWFHRLGLAKPLGFGSLKTMDIQVTKTDHSKRYRTFAEQGTEGLEEVDYINIFKDAMKEGFGREFHELENVQDLAALLGKEPPLPVHYPRQSRIPTPDGEQFKWFVDNDRNRDRHVPLPIAPEDTEGFEY